MNLANYQAQLEAFFDNITQAVVVLDLDNKIIKINQVCINLSKILDPRMTPDEIEAVYEVMLPNGKVLPPEKWPVYAAFRAEYVQDFGLSMRNKKTGKIYYFEFNTAPIKNEEGKVTQIIVRFRDITEQKQQEHQLRQSQKMEAVGQLTGGVAHDFNNLLGIILGNLDLLERMLSENEEASKRVKTIQKAATRGADITKRLLEFSRLQQLNPAPISLEKTINNTLEIATQTFGPDIKIITQLNKTMPLVYMDASELEIALLNLAINARDAMPKGGTITVSTELKTIDPDYAPVQTGEMKAGVYACIHITDTGLGMSAETIAHAFEPFFTTKPRGKGTGLGLSMVYGFMTQSGGHVTIYSELDHGTTITLYLPLADRIPVPLEQAVRLNQPQTRGTVLVVDDEPDLLDIAVIYLKEMGYTVLQATDATTALAIVDREPEITLLITDIIMPGGMNGVELANLVRQKKPDTVIMYSSGFPSGALAERSGMMIDAPLLNKPYQRETFVTAVRRVMEKQHPES